MQGSCIQGKLFFSSRLTRDGLWSSFEIKAFCKPVAAGCRARFPILCQLLDDHPTILKAMVSVLAPGAVIHPHHGPTTSVLRVHLGIQCPPGALLNLDGRSVRWRRGEVVVWDDTFTHSVQNASDVPRVILYLDVRRPLAKGRLRWLQHLSECVGKHCLSY